MSIFSLTLYYCALLAFAAIDMNWLVLAACGFYQKHLGFFMRINLNWSAATLCYLPTDSTKKALVLGALFGLIAYAAYALTNMATVKDWPWVVTVADLAWGCLLATAVSYIGFLAGIWLRTTASAPTKSLATRRIYECCWTEG